MPSQAVFKSQDNNLYTTSTGAPVARPYAAQRIGKVGPLLLQGASMRSNVFFPGPRARAGYGGLSQAILTDLPFHADFHHIDLLAHFGRERIPGAWFLLVRPTRPLG